MELTRKIKGIMLLKNRDVGCQRPVTVKHPPRDLKHPPARSRLWKLCKLQDHIPYCWSQISPKQQETTSQEAGPRTTENSEQPSSVHWAGPQGKRGMSSTSRAESLPNACPVGSLIAVDQLPQWISESALFPIRVSTVVVLFLVHIFYEFCWRRWGSEQSVFELIGLRIKRTHYPECMDFILDAAPGENLGLSPSGRRPHRYLASRRSGCGRNG